ncbi:uncharacterized protein Dwil_GK20560 [Drosophila willistoni]|nr:uncharacterized protein Dwil_GK20560 [Drosophila willistoni]
MVVSKDSKRRRKETETPPPPTAAATTTTAQTTAASAAAATAVESSPEMPKRTKVQAQRKFAQGQSAPSSSSSSAAAAAAAAAAACMANAGGGPSTSSGGGGGAGGAGEAGGAGADQNQQPPIEILPNKCPKPQDFLTFLCFRNTPALPAHLDFLNQGKSKDSEAASSNNNNNNNNKKGNRGGGAGARGGGGGGGNAKKKRGRPAKGQAAKGQELRSTQSAAAASNKTKAVASTPTTQSATPLPKPPGAAAILPGAVRKRAEVVAEGNRRGAARGRGAAAARATDTKCNTDAKRRSNRSIVKDSKPLIDGSQTDDDDDEDEDQDDDDHDDDDEDEYFSAHDASSRNGIETAAPPEQVETKSEPPAKRGRPAVVKKVTNVETAAVSEKSAAPVKRLRQKESPIFIPSPESSGRMTRQRAFFEPVKVLPVQENENEKDREREKDKQKQKEDKVKSQNEKEEKKLVKDLEPVKAAAAEPKEKTNSSIYAKDAHKQRLENGSGGGATSPATATATGGGVGGGSSSSGKGKKSLNVFDFSSDDEQPLAKTIKLKKGGKASPKKSPGAAAAAVRGRKTAGAGAKKQQQLQQQQQEKAEKTKDKEKAKEDEPKSKLGKNKADDDSPIAPQGLKKPLTQLDKPQARQQRGNKQTKAIKSLPETEEIPTPPQRTPRPSRKTKEAAAIYMGIIGHKLQLADDEEDDLSLSSFPDIPNVKEMEKMENEIKKNAAGKASPAPPPPPQPQPLTTASSASKGGEGTSAQAQEVEKPSAASTPTPTPPTAPATAAAPARRGRPPKQGKGTGAAAAASAAAGAGASTAPPQIEGMLIKKGSLAKVSSGSEQTTTGKGAQTKAKSEQSKKVDSDEEEDFLINEELNETKRKLEKSFSDSDDEPLAIKVPVASHGAGSSSSMLRASNKDTPTNPPSSPAIGAAAPAPTTGKLKSPSPVKPTAGGLPTAAGVGTTVSPLPTTNTTSSQFSMLPVTNKSAASSTLGSMPMPTGNATISPPTFTAPGGGLKPMEKKSPVPTSKILNVPATYALPGQKTSSYLPQASPHYHATGYVRPPPTPTHQFGGGGGAGVAPGGKTPSQAAATTSPLKYQTPPTTYPPPIEAYQCPKINPNFLTPKYERGPLPPRSAPAATNFPTPAPVKFMPTPAPATTTVGGTTSQAGAANTSPAIQSNTSNTNYNKSVQPASPPVVVQPQLVQAQSMSLNLSLPPAAAAAGAPGPPPPTSTAAAPTAIPPAVPSTSAAAAAAAAAAAVAANISTSTQTPPPAHRTAAVGAADPLKDEIGSILAQANLMPSKEESGKIFGIASVSLAQSSGPDNTKCTLGKCGSIHKPVLGPVVPTEGYFGDQLSSKERRKAKVNMTHEQIQKWLIECSSNPDEIQDDLDDDFDDSLRPQQSTTPPASNARDEKEASTVSLSSSSKNTRGDLGKSDSAWSAKGPSLKATPVMVVPLTRKDQQQQQLSAAVVEESKDTDGMESTPVNLTQKPTTTTAAAEMAEKTTKQAATANEKKTKELTKSSKAAATSTSQKSPTPTPTPTATPPPPQPAAPPAAAATTTTAAGGKQKAEKGKKTPAAGPSSSSTATTPTKRTPQQQQQQQQTHQAESKTTTNPSQKRGSDPSIYAFGKEEESSTSKPTNRRRLEAPTPPPPLAAPATANSSATVPNALSERSPTKKRAAAAAAATAVQLTLSPTENCKIEGAVKTKAATGRVTKKQQKEQQKQQQLEQQQQQVATSGGDSDNEGATFYIPLQGAGVGGTGDPTGIQGVAVKLGREGPDGPNQKVVMQATLVTKAQMDTNSKPLPESLNTNELVKTLLHAASSNNDAASSAASIKSLPKASTSAAAAAAAAASAATATGTGTGTTGTGTGTGTSLVRVNSNSSLFSGSVKSRTAAQTSSTAAAIAKKYKDDTPIKMANNTAFPRHDDPTQMVEAPIFRPSEKEFADPIEFIERITPLAARFGICKIIPPASFKPECRISDEMRFTAYNQYVHKMLHRWGPSAKELSAIKKYLTTQSIVMNHPPWIGGMEVDLPRLYHTVQELGGLKEVIEKKKWSRVAEEMCIPKLAQDRVTKLDDIYCKYLLPYDTLSPAERQKLFDEVEADWAKREARARRNADRFVNTESVSNEEDDVSSDEDEESEEEIDGVSMECIVKGRSMPLSQFYRIARNTMALWFKSTDPTVNEVEAEFWRHVAVRDSHVCVHSGSIDSSGWGYGFPSPGPKGKGSNYARHPWNLKVLTNNAGSVLRSLGPVMGVTVPTLHVGMLFSACCWYRDPHGLSWIEYLHTGASKLWYGIPDDQSANFRAALTSLIPTHCQNKTIWLPCDTVMVPPHMLTDRGVSLCRIEQKPGEFIVVFPRAYTSSLATGYVVSESVYFATMSWLDLAKDDFRDIHESCEPAMFSLEQLLFALGYDQRVNSEALQQMLPMLNEVCEKESAAREQLRAAGVTSTEKVQAEKGQKASKKQQQPPHKSIESECDLCRANLYISMVRTEEGNVYCLQHALKNLNNGNIQAKQCKLIYAYNLDDIQQLIRQLQEKIHHKAVVKKK